MAGKNYALKLSNFVTMARDFKVSHEERFLFDWLIFTHCHFGLGEPFRHSLPQIKLGARVSRFTIEKSFKHFVDCGFLTIVKSEYNKIIYNSYKVDFGELSKDAVLGQIITAGSSTFEVYKEMILNISEKQRTEENPLMNNKSELTEEEPPKKRFVPPTLEEVAAYCLERGNMVDPAAFFDFYEANGWVQGSKAKSIADWKACVRTWERNGIQNRHGQSYGKVNTYVDEQTPPSDADYKWKPW